MKLKPVSSLMSVTLGDVLAMCKLFQMHSHENEFEQISMADLRRYMKTSLGLEDEGADAMINRSRRTANRILSKYEAD